MRNQTYRQSVGRLRVESPSALSSMQNTQGERQHGSVTVPDQQQARSFNPSCKGVSCEYRHELLRVEVIDGAIFAERRQDHNVGHGGLGAWCFVYWSMLR